MINRNLIFFIGETQYFNHWKWCLIVRVDTVLGALYVKGGMSYTHVSNGHALDAVSRRSNTELLIPAGAFGRPENGTSHPPGQSPSPDAISKDTKSL